jgi:hypothetical protein
LIQLSYNRVEAKLFVELIDNGIISDLASKFNNQMEQLNEEDWSRVPMDTLDQMKRVCNRFAGDCIEDFDPCLEAMETNMCRKKRR